MNRDLLDVLCCPACRGALALSARESHDDGRVETGGLTCVTCGTGYPIVRGVPRFVQSDAYVESFSYEWRRWSRVQLDPANGRRESAETFTSKTGLDAADVKGRRALDVGCGAGRFLEVVSRWGGRAVGVDCSFAVDAAQANLADRPGIDVIQADIFHLPFRDGAFDIVFSIGVLHHTRDTREAFMRLPPLVRDGGVLAVWLYYYTDELYKRASDWWRRVFSRVPPWWAYGWSWMLAAALHPLYRSRWCQRAPLSYVPRLVPISPHADFHWRVLDTFDWLTPRYQDKECSPQRVIGWFGEAGLRDIELLSYPTSVRARRDDAARLPLLTHVLPCTGSPRFVIFGAGSGGAFAVRGLHRLGLAGGIVAVCDNDAAVRGTVRFGHRVQPFDSLARDSYDFVLVASAPGYSAIATQLERAGLTPNVHFGSLEYLEEALLPLYRAAAA